MNQGYSPDSLAFQGLYSGVEGLAAWLDQEDEPNLHIAGKGYSKGSIVTRGSDAVRGLRANSSVILPFAPFLKDGFSWEWKLLERAEPVFQTVASGSRRSGEEGPPGPSERLLALAEALPCCHQEGVQRIIAAHTTGWWAKHHLDTRTDLAEQRPVLLSEPANHFLVLRAPGVGDYVRLRRKSDFDFLCSPSGPTVLGFGFETEIEAWIFCRAAQIPLPALFERCQ